MNSRTTEVPGQKVRQGATGYSMNRRVVEQQKWYSAGRVNNFTQRSSFYWAGSIQTNIMTLARD
jgi:hypothetical protein